MRRSNHSELNDEDLTDQEIREAIQHLDPDISVRKVAPELREHDPVVVFWVCVAMIVLGYLVLLFLEHLLSS